MAYGTVPYAGGSFAGSDSAEIVAHDSPVTAVEVSFSTNALDAPVWVNISQDVREWSCRRGRQRELERFQPGRATVVLDNRDADYDSKNSSGPWFGNLRPMRRIRVRETFQEATYGIFDGYVDRWLPSYPNVGKDAITTVLATDGFKMFARTNMPRSIYTQVIDEDDPVLWWRLDETMSQGDEEAIVGNSGTGGSSMDGTVVGPPQFQAQTLVVNDPGASIFVENPNQVPGTELQEITLGSSALNLFAFNAFMIEGWCRPAVETPDVINLATGTEATNPRLALQYHPTLDGGRFQFWIEDDGDGGAGNVTGVKSAGNLPIHVRYHVVGRKEANGQLAIYVDGVRSTTPATEAGFNGNSTVGTITGAVDFHVGADNIVVDIQWHGQISEVSVYTASTTAGLPSDSRIASRNAAGRTPWKNDTPAVRAARVLNLVGWPGLRELDEGTETFQSADVFGQTALEHLRKIGESESAVLFMSKDGKVRMISRANLFARTSQGTFGDQAGEVGYRNVEFDDGDTVIRNAATISRLNGVAKTAEDTASIDEFGRFDFVLEGLLHRLDSHSQEYADFVVAEYKDPRRRVVSLDLGPAVIGEEPDLYPQMLGRELADVVTVKLTPLGGGTAFSQVCAIEGIEHASAPGGVRTTRWMLSPDFTGSF